MNEDKKFWIRICFYLVLILLLVWVGLKAGGDPCEKCKISLTEGVEPQNCREYIEEVIEPMFGGRIGELVPSNFSFGD